VGPKRDSEGVLDLLVSARGRKEMVTYEVETELDIEMRGAIKRMIVSDGWIDPSISDPSTGTCSLRRALVSSRLGEAVVAHLDACHSIPAGRQKRSAKRSSSGNADVPTLTA
jgi:hypothetical protein